MDLSVRRPRATVSGITGRLAAIDRARDERPGGGNAFAKWATKVAGLEEAWRAVRRELTGRSVSLDVKAVGYVDEAGKYLLARCVAARPA